VTRIAATQANSMIEAIRTKRQQRPAPLPRIRKDDNRVTIYLLCFAVETAGMFLILWDGVPIFRNLVRFQQATTTADTTILAIGVLCIQATYWKWLRRDPPFDLPEMPLGGHIMIFVARLSFIFASSVFSFVVYRASDMFEFTFVRSLLGMLVLFSVFCFMRHLERVGTLMLSGHRAASRK
jgi:hypothetical protein